MFFERQIFISYTANKALFQALSQPVAEVIKYLLVFVWLLVVAQKPLTTSSYKTSVIRSELAVEIVKRWQIICQISLLTVAIALPLSLAMTE